MPMTPTPGQLAQRSLTGTDGCPRCGHPHVAPILEFQSLLDWFECRRCEHRWSQLPPARRPDASVLKSSAGLGTRLALAALDTLLAARRAFVHPTRLRIPLWLLNRRELHPIRFSELCRSDEHRLCVRHVWPTPGQGGKMPNNNFGKDKDQQSGQKDQGGQKKNPAQGGEKNTPEPSRPTQGANRGN